MFGFGGPKAKVNKVVKTVKKYFKKRGVKMKVEKDGKSCTLSCFVSFAKQPNALLNIDYDVSMENYLDVSLTFNRIPTNEYTLTLLNLYNDESMYWKAYIDAEERFLTFEHETGYVRPEDVVKFIDTLLDFVAEEENLKYYNALCEEQEA